MIQLYVPQEKNKNKIIFRKNILPTTIFYDTNKNKNNKGIRSASYNIYVNHIIMIKLWKVCF